MAPYWLDRLTALVLQPSLEPASNVSSQTVDFDGFRLEWHPLDSDSLLGEGAFGSFYRGTVDAAEVAIKVIKRSMKNEKAQESAIQQFEREVRRLENLKHPHVVQFLGAVVDSSTSQTLLVTELLSGGSLPDAFEVMRRYGPKGDGGAILDERSFLRIASSIARGLLYLHNSKYTHGDMKPHNILLNSPVEITGWRDANELS